MAATTPFGPIDRRRLGLLLAGLGLAAAHPVAAQDVPQDEVLETGHDLVRRLTTAVHIDGGPPVNFVVDTGANATVISEELAMSLNLPVVGTATVHGIAGARIAPLVRAAELRVGTQRMKDKSMPALPRGALGGDGLLGLDAMRNRELSLDLRANRIVIRQPDHTPTVNRLRTSSRLSRQMVVGGYQRSGQLTVLRGRAGGQRLDVFVDTGAQQSIGNLELLRLARPVRLGADQSSEVVIYGATGDQALGTLAMAPQIELEGLRFLPWILPFADIHTFSLWGLSDRPALIMGMDILQTFREVTLDLSTSEARFAGLAAPTQYADRPLDRPVPTRALG